MLVAQPGLRTNDLRLLILDDQEVGFIGSAAAGLAGAAPAGAIPALADHGQSFDIEVWFGFAPVFYQWLAASWGAEPKRAPQMKWVGFWVKLFGAERGRPRLRPQPSSRQRGGIARVPGAINIYVVSLLMQPDADHQCREGVKLRKAATDTALPVRF